MVCSPQPDIRRQKAWAGANELVYSIRPINLGFVQEQSFSRCLSLRTLTAPVPERGSKTVYAESSPLLKINFKFSRS